MEELIESFDVKDHFYSDDTQVLTRMRIYEVKCRKSNIERCVLAKQDWFSEKRLQLNPDTAEVIWFCS